MVLCLLRSYDRTRWANGNMYQMTSAIENQKAGAGQGGVNQGRLLYKAHGNRFNYLFHDGHVLALEWTKTIGKGTPTAPQGMWTLTPGD